MRRTRSARMRSPVSRKPLGAIPPLAAWTTVVLACACTLARPGPGGAVDLLAVNSDGLPQGGVLVTITSTEGDLFRNVVTSADGSYRLLILPAGTYWMACSKGTHKPITSRQFTVGNGGTRLVACIIDARPLIDEGALPRTSQESGEVMAVLQDLNGDGLQDRLSIVMTRGHDYIDEVLWCGGDGTEKVEGEFEICVEFAGKKAVCTPLNPLLSDPNVYFQYGVKQLDQPDLWFRAEPWTIEIADYNHDGRPDFALGQYGGCRGWGYTLLTVQPSGVVVRIVTDHLFVKGAFGNSTCFDLTADGFQHSAWDDGIDDYWCEEYGRRDAQGTLKLVKRTRGGCPYWEPFAQ